MCMIYVCMYVFFVIKNSFYLLIKQKYVDDMTSNNKPKLWVQVTHVCACVQLFSILFICVIFYIYKNKK